MNNSRPTFSRHFRETLRSRQEFANLTAEEGGFEHSTPTQNEQREPFQYGEFKLESTFWQVSPPAERSPFSPFYTLSHDIFTTFSFFALNGERSDPTPSKSSPSWFLP